MISASVAWRFIEPLATTGFFEDEVVEHLGTTHRARRRSFSPKLSQDEQALAEICRQAALAATVQHPSLPRFYGGELTDGRYTVIAELVEGRPMLDKTVRTRPTFILDWCDICTNLVETMIHLEKLRVDFSRLRASHVVLGRRNRVRFTTTWPVAHIDKSRLAQSPFLARMVASPYGGPFVSDSPIDPLAVTENLQAVLFHFAIGRDTKTVAEALEEERKELIQSGLTELPSSLGVEKSVGDLILRLIHPSGARDLTTLPAVLSALRQLRAATLKAQADARSASISASRTNVRTDLASASSRPSSVMPVMPPPAPSATPDPRSGPKSLISDSKNALPSPTRQAPRPAEEISSAPVRHRPQRSDAEPEASKPQYTRPAAELEDDAGESLYPRRPDVVETAAGAQVHVSDLPAAPSLWPRRLAVAGAFLAVAAIAWFAFSSFQSSRATKMNRKPVALIASAPGGGQVVDRLAFDGTGSSDPENQPLTYYWDVTEPAGADKKIWSNNSASAVRTEIQFFAAGEYTVQLRVFDGLVYSDPATVRVVITNR